MRERVTAVPGLCLTTSQMSDAMNPVAASAVSRTRSRSNTVPRTSRLDTLGILLNVFLPTVAKGVIVRRPMVLAIADALDLDRRAIRAMQRLRSEYGSAPLLLRVPGRALAVVLDPQDVHRVLAESPDPFATATPEKTAALAHFEPKVVLLSGGSERADRRRYNEQVLESHRPIHQMAHHFLAVVKSEANRLRAHIGRDNDLNWSKFSDSWFRIVRRVIFGDDAINDNELSLMMFKLRSAANWAFLRPQQRDVRDRLLARISSYLAKADPNSLAGLMAKIPATSVTAPEQQVPQWLFAFDPAGMTTLRSLALLATHPEQAQTARSEAEASDESQPRVNPFLRATVLESLRLWPTSPLILRQSNRVTEWSRGMMPENTGVVIFAPFFHRDDERLPYANSFVPDLWLGDQPAHQGAALIPFSEGPGICPGRELVLFLTTAMLSELLRDTRVRLRNPNKFAPGKPVPATLNHFRLHFELVPGER
jgi:cytochrome P450